MEKQKLKQVMNYLCSFAEVLGEMGLKELKQFETKAEVLAAKEELEVSQKILIAAFEELRVQYDRVKQL